MRYSQEHKQATHQRLVKGASQLFRLHGGEGISIADLMDTLQLTHGGFYRHFASKDDLFAQALTASFEQKLAEILQATDNLGRPQKLKAIIEHYLSVEHCINRADGCPVVALSAEIARHTQPVRTAFDQGLRAYIEEISVLLPGASAAERQQNALALFSGMVGALSVARAVTDQTLQAQILAAARELYYKTYNL